MTTRPDECEANRPAGLANIPQLSDAPESRRCHEISVEPLRGGIDPRRIGEIAVGAIRSPTRQRSLRKARRRKGMRC
jgi:hypothetical protein